MKEARSLWDFIHPLSFHHYPRTWAIKAADRPKPERKQNTTHRDSPSYIRSMKDAGRGRLL